MTGKRQDLNGLRKLGECNSRLQAPLLVKINQHLIYYNRQALGMLCQLLYQTEPQR